MNYLIAIDSDGTLRKSDGTISNRTCSAITNLINKNNIVVVCTARPRYHTKKIANMVNASPYLISSNGTEIYDNSLNKIIYSTYLDGDVCKKVYYDTKKLNLRVMFVSENTEYVTKFTRNEDQVLLTDNNLEEIFNRDIKQIMVIDKDKDNVKIYKDSLMNNDKLSVVDSSRDDKEEMWFSMISSNASKGNALKILAEYLNIPLSNTIAIGNDNNDVSMLEIANVGVAVENSTEDLKQIANVITKSNDEDGVAIYLESLLNVKSR